LPTFQTRRRVPFTPQQMFAVVAEVEAYPEFLPLCESLRVLRREQRGDATVLVARMSVGYKAIRESFTSCVTLYPAEPRVLVEYLDGPFRTLENRWLFHPVPLGTEIDFYIAYEFRSAMLGLVMGAMFDRAFRRFAEAFEERARLVYGRAAQPA
jgi:coenzyme Q-binding protein COQ10